MAIEITVTGATPKAAKKIAQAMQASVPNGGAMQIQTVSGKTGTSVTLVQQSKAEMLADELIDLELKLRAIDYAGIAVRQKQIKEQLQVIAADEPKDQKVVFTGTKGVVELSVVAQKVEVTESQPLMVKLIKKAGVEAAYDALTFNLTKLKKLLSENEIMEYAHMVDGSRTTKIKPSTEVVPPA